MILPLINFAQAEGKAGMFIISSSKLLAVRVKQIIELLQEAKDKTVNYFWYAVSLFIKKL